MHMTFHSTRNEISRAQTQLDQVRASFEAIQGDKIAHPKFRNVDKKAWVDPKRPFRITKPDEKLMSVRTSSTGAKGTTHIKEPYTGISQVG